MWRAICIVVAAVVAIALFGSAIAGFMLAGAALHPTVRPLTPDLIQLSYQIFGQVNAQGEDMVVQAPDGVRLRGWKVRPAEASHRWVLLFHGQSDNRAGMLGQAAFLLRHDYGVIMMDSRAHGESGGTIATYGWLEKRDTQAIIDALYAKEPPGLTVFALGSSMGAAIAFQSAGVDQRILGVVAESPFSNLREATYDYAGLHRTPWLGKTLFRPATWTGLSELHKEGGFSADDVSPERSVAMRQFPVLLICDGHDHTLPCRHTEAIFKAATGPKQLWEVPLAGHASALGTVPAEYENRVLTFFEKNTVEPRESARGDHFR